MRQSIWLSVVAGSASWNTVSAVSTASWLATSPYALASNAVGEQRHGASGLTILFGVRFPIQHEILVMRTDGAGGRELRVSDSHGTREV